MPSISSSKAPPTLTICWTSLQRSREKLDGRQLLDNLRQARGGGGDGETRAQWRRNCIRGIRSSPSKPNRSSAAQRRLRPYRLARNERSQSSEQITNKRA